MQITDDMVEAAAKKLYEMRHLTRWEALGECSKDIYLIEARAMLRTAAALSDKQAGETFTREQMLAEVDRRVERALAARSALVDVPAVEPVGEVGEMPGSNGGFTMAVFKASDVPLGTKLYRHPPLSREGADSAEVVTLTRAEADRIAQRLEFDASWDKCGDGYYSIKRQLGTLAATRSGSATTQKGTDHE